MPASPSATWTDAHNHLQDPRLGNKPAAIISAMRNEGIARCVVNATREADWPAVSALAAAHPDHVLPAYGIHPWHAHTATDGWLERLHEHLDADPRASLGECGLDQWVATPTLASQLPVFSAQLDLARETRRPITLHCLRAWGPLMETLRRQPPTAPILLHAFNGSAEIARELVELGAYFSFNGYFLHERKARQRDTFRHIPHERILIETDAPDMTPPASHILHPLPDGRNHPANLPAAARALAALLDLSVDDLASRTRANFHSCFGAA